eukprot:TRINITY_DN10338_c0_g1_i1.p1 TRINITY_DN10338_c0_g1~~TRINITY_DN10338_c0_g1_i1.p1  ORF type:complete len:458 (+),score=127.31 TRINITY_DN10338_c0_g1_i1:33-1406(+)
MALYLRKVSRRRYVNRVARRGYCTSLQTPKICISNMYTNTLENGVRVASQVNNSELATIGVYADAGSLYETEKQSGAAKIIEKLAFSQSDKDEASKLGASLNAHVTKEHTALVAQCLKKDVPKVFEILAKAVTSPSYTQQDVDEAVAQIANEKDTLEDDVVHNTYDYLYTAAFQNTPLANSVYGNATDISVDDVKEFQTNHFTAKKLVVVANGGVNSEEVNTLTNNNFGKVDSTNLFDYNTIGSLGFTGSEVRIRDETHPQIELAFGFEVPGATDPHYYTFRLMQSLIGEFDQSVGNAPNLTSYLAEQLSGYNLAHSMEAFYHAYNTTGIFGIYSAFPELKHEDAVRLLFGEFQRVGKIAREVDVDRAKEILKGQILRNNQSSTFVNRDIGIKTLSLGRYISPSEEITRINDIELNDVQSAANEYFNDQDPAVSSLGPIGALADYMVMRGKTYWTRW